MNIIHLIQVLEIPILIEDDSFLEMSDSPKFIFICFSMPDIFKQCFLDHSLTTYLNRFANHLVKTYTIENLQHHILFRLFLKLSIAVYLICRFTLLSDHLFNIQLII